MATISVSNEKLISFILAILVLLFIIIGSAENSAVYFVIATLCLIVAIGIHFVSKQCLTKFFQTKEVSKTSDTINSSDPTNNKPTIADPPVVKLQEVKISS